MFARAYVKIWNDRVLLAYKGGSVRCWPRSPPNNQCRQSGRRVRRVPSLSLVVRALLRIVGGLMVPEVRPLAGRTCVARKGYSVRCWLSPPPNNQYQWSGHWVQRVLSLGTGAPPTRHEWVNGTYSMPPC
jgi:hypothetical protein